MEAWQDPEFRRLSSSFEGYCTMLGLGSVGPYMQAKQAHTLGDWSSVPLDPEGKKLQEDMTRKFQVCILQNRILLLP